VRGRGGGGFWRISGRKSSVRSAAGREQEGAVEDARAGAGSWAGMSAGFFRQRWAFKRIWRGGFRVGAYRYARAWPEGFG